MISQKNIKKILEKQGHRIIGSHGAVKICNWCKQSLRNKGECYKSKFYGIPSWRCVQMSPWIACENKCLHCWRAIELDMNTLIDKKKTENPEKIIEECIKGRKKLLSGFGGRKKMNMEKYKEALEPTHFAISLIGEPTIYPYIGEMIELLRKKGKTTFLVTNGLHPEKIKEMARKKQLPTQLYISLNTPNEWLYKKWHNSSMKDAWKKFNESLSLMKKLKSKTRTVIRMTLVRELNMQPEFIEQYAKLIKKAQPLFVEVDAFKSVGYARKRLGYEMMPSMKEIDDYAKALAKSSGMKVLGKHEHSRIVLLGKNKARMKIKEEEI